MDYVVGSDDGFDVVEIHIFEHVVELYEDVDHGFDVVDVLELSYFGLNWLIKVHDFDDGFINDPRFKMFVLLLVEG